MERSTSIFSCDRHNEILGWWQSRHVHHATLIHVDSHHDLGYGDLPSVPHEGDFLAAAIAGEVIDDLVWVVPASRAALAIGGGAGFVASLPASASDIVQESPGRWVGSAHDCPLRIRAWDDMRDLRFEDRDVELTIDLDFFYHPVTSGPLCPPMQALHAILEGSGVSTLRGVSLCWSAESGFVPPTYRLLIDWLRITVETGRAPCWSGAVWRLVMDVELLRSEGASVEFAVGGDYPELTETMKLWLVAWLQYLDKDPASAQTFRRLPEELRVNPSEELLTAHQWLVPPPKGAIARYRELTEGFGSLPQAVRRICDYMLAIEAAHERVIWNWYES